MSRRKRTDKQIFTRRYAYIAASLFFCALAGTVTGNRIYFVTIGFMLTLIALSCAWMLAVKASFRYLQHLSVKQCSRGETVKCTVDFENHSILPYPYVRVDYRTVANLYISKMDQLFTAISPRKSEQLVCDIATPHCGVFEVGLERVTVRDAFGLWQWNVNMKAYAYHRMGRITVYPRVLPIAHMPLPLQKQEGLANGPQHDTEELSTVSDIRSYRYGDSLKRIHWKLSARRREMLIKLYESASRPQVLIMPDLSPVPYEAEEGARVKDAVLECASSLCSHFIGQYLPIRMVCYEKQREEFVGVRASDFQAFYDYLANVRFDSGFQPEKTLAVEAASLAGKGTLITISSRVNPAVGSYLMALTAQGINVYAVFALPRALRDQPEYAHIADEFAAHGVQALIVSDAEEFCGKVAMLR